MQWACNCMNLCTCGSTQKRMLGVSSPIALCFILLRQGLSLKHELMVSVRMAASKLPGSACLNTSVLGLLVVGMQRLLNRSSASVRTH